MILDEDRHNSASFDGLTKLTTLKSVFCLKKCWERIVVLLGIVLLEIKTVQVLKSHSTIENTKDKMIFNKTDNNTTTFDCYMT